MDVAEATDATTFNDENGDAVAPLIDNNIKEGERV